MSWHLFSVAMGNVKLREIYLYPGAAIETDIDSTTKEDVIALWKLECSETGRQRIAVHCIEIFKEIRVD